MFYADLHIHSKHSRATSRNADLLQLSRIGNLASDGRPILGLDSRDLLEITRLIANVGAELFVLEQAPIEELRFHGSNLLAEAISRMREGRVIREAGYDGQYGTIRLFEENELKR